MQTERHQVVKGYDADDPDWKYINPDGSPDESMLKRTTKAIIEIADPLKVILFGSAARGEMHRKSDLDILIIKEGCHRRRTAAAIHRRLTGDRRAIHITVIRPEDADCRGDEYNSLTDVIREGRVLHDASKTRSA